MVKVRMPVLVRAAMGLALLGSVAATPMAASAQAGSGASGIAQFCQDIAEVSIFSTVGECVSTLATLLNPGQAEGVGFCKLIFAEFNIPQQFFGQCVRELQAGQ